MNLKLFESEYRFMELIWEKEPIGSGELVKLCNERFDWKKSTTYTMLKKLIEKGFVENKESMVKSLVSKEKAEAYASEQFVENRFKGSLPDFLVAFLGAKRLSENEANQLKKLIDEYKEND